MKYNSNGDTDIEVNTIPLINFVAAKGMLAAIQILIEKGNADINYIDPRNGNTPLMDAASNGHIEIVQYLSSQGAELTKTNNAGLTVYDFAKIHGHQPIIDFIEGNLNSSMSHRK